MEEANTIGTRFFDKTITNLMENINEFKKEILLSKLRSKGIVLDLEIEAKSRFKSIVVETQLNKETWYYNNGTLEGQRIVTFERIEKDMSSLDSAISIGIRIKYY